MVEHLVTLRPMVFVRKLVTRKPFYPFDVVCRSGPQFVFVSEELWTPSGRYVAKNFYRTWPYGADWKMIAIPGQAGFELVLNRHIENDGHSL